MTVGAHAREILLRRLLEDVLENMDDHEMLQRGFPIYKELVLAGVSGEALRNLIRSVALDCLSSATFRIDEGYDPEAESDAPGWILLATTSDGDVLPEPIEGLHEDIPAV